MHKRSSATHRKLHQFDHSEKHFSDSLVVLDSIQPNWDRESYVNGALRRLRADQSEDGLRQVRALFNEDIVKDALSQLGLDESRRKTLRIYNFNEEPQKNPLTKLKISLDEGGGKYLPMLTKEGYTGKVEKRVLGGHGLRHSVNTHRLKLRIAVFASGAQARSALTAGASFVGMEDLIYAIKISLVKTGKIDFDIVLATPQAMRLVSQIATALGSRGLMPSAKAGTLTPNVTAAVDKLLMGKALHKSSTDEEVRQLQARFFRLRKDVLNTEKTVRADSSSDSDFGGLVNTKDLAFMPSNGDVHIRSKRR
jgi:hypothetical protein